MNLLTWALQSDNLLKDNNLCLSFTAYTLVENLVYIYGGVDENQNLQSSLYTINLDTFEINKIVSEQKNSNPPALMSGMMTSINSLTLLLFGKNK